MPISNIIKRGNWYDIYDEKGDKIKTISTNIGLILGFSSVFIVVERGNWYYLYNDEGKKYKAISINIGIVISVTGKGV